MTDTAVVTSTQEGVVITNLVHIENNQAVVSSREIAEHFGKQHKNVLQTIENIKAENSAVTSMFFETSYTAGTGKPYKEYLMNRDGFSLLVMGFTGKEALDWKLRYIEEFNRMEEYIRQQQQPKMSLLEIVAANAQALVDQERRLAKHDQDIAQIKRVLQHPLSDLNIRLSADKRQLTNHEDRITRVETFTEDPGPASEIKTLIVDAHRTDPNYSYEDLYTSFYDTLRTRYNISINQRLSALKARRREQGWSESRIKKISKLDAITANPDIWQPVRAILQAARTVLVEQQQQAGDLS